MTHYSDSFKRAAASLAAVCTLGTCCIVGSVAWAGEGEGNAPAAPSTADILTDKNNQTSITIHKYEGPELKDSNTIHHDGRALDSTALVDTVGGKTVAKKPVRKVEFTIWRLKTYKTGPNTTGQANQVDEEIDLSKAEGWKKINKIQYLKLPKEAESTTKPAAGGSSSTASTTPAATPQEPTYTVDQLMNGDSTLTTPLAKQFNKYTDSGTLADTSENANANCTVALTKTATGAKCVTKDDGSVKLDNLPMGLYYIEETNISNAEIDFGTSAKPDWKKVSITKTVAPFFITTPLPNSDPDTQKDKPWLYGVHVYPKNDTNTELPTKTGDVNRNDLVGDTEVPKKSDSSQKKTVEGTHITWTIAIPLTAPTKDQKYTKIGFVDRLSDKLTFVNKGNHKLKAKIVVYKEQTKEGSTEKEWVPDNGDGAIAEAPLTTEDYTLTEPSTTNNNTLTFTLKDNVENHGLKIAEAKYEDASKSKDVKKLAKLVVEIVTKVTDLTANEIANVANTFVDDNKTGDGDGTDPCVPGDKREKCKDKDIPNTVMHFGTLTVSKFFKAGVKKGATGTKMPLNDAKFDIYEVTTKVVTGKESNKVEATDITKATTFDAVDLTKPVSTIARTAKDKVTAAKFNVNKITHDEPTDADTSKTTPEATTLETHHNDSATKDEDKDGKDSIRLLVYKAPKDNPKSVDTSKLYCLVETKAPAGYRLDSAPHCVWLKEDSTTDTTVATNNLVEVENSRATELDKIIGALPMTGARGLVILTICGILGIAGTFFYIVLKRRKEQEQE